MHNRLTMIGTQFGLYSYSPDGHRVRAEGASYVVDPNASLSRVLMRQKDGVTTYYVWGLGLLYEETAGDTRTYHTDHLGSTLLVTDGAGATTDRFEYDAYGTVSYRQGTTQTPFQWHGTLGVMTDNNGLVYMRARYYHPRLMRFLNQDPIGFEGGMNWYAFVGNNPMGNVDPAGLQAAGFGGASSMFAYGEAQAAMLQHPPATVSDALNYNPNRIQSPEAAIYSTAKYIATAGGDPLKQDLAIAAAKGYGIGLLTIGTVGAGPAVIAGGSAFAAQSTSFITAEIALAGAAGRQIMQEATRIVQSVGQFGSTMWQGAIEMQQSVLARLPALYNSSVSLIQSLATKTPGTTIFTYSNLISSVSGLVTGNKMGDNKSIFQPNRS